MSIKHATQVSKAQSLDTAIEIDYEEWNEAHNITGRFGLANMPAGTANYVLKGTGVGSPVYGQVDHSELIGVGTSDHHTKYTDDETILAVQREPTLDLEGNVTVATDKSFSTDWVIITSTNDGAKGIQFQNFANIHESIGDIVIVPNDGREVRLAQGTGINMGASGRAISNVTTLTVSTINERIEDAGVIIETVLFKDGSIGIAADKDLIGLANGIATIRGDIVINETAIFDAEYDNGSQNSNYTLDWNDGNKQKITLTGSFILTFTNPIGPCNLILKIIQDSTGSRIITWDAGNNNKWAGGVAPTLSIGGNDVDVLAFYFDGTNYYGLFAGDFS